MEDRYCLKSTRLCTVMPLSRYILWVCVKFAHFLYIIATFIDQNYDDTNDNGYQQEDIVEIEQCEIYSEKDELTCEDIMKILNSLNTERLQTKEILKDHDIYMEGIYELLEDKEASLEELKQVFHVFDHDEDGFISAFELWSVLRRLGFKEGMKFEDCEKMIRTCDLDGDGMISFHEFKQMMENAS